jgi:hypothetical protein
MIQENLNEKEITSAIENESKDNLPEIEETELNDDLEDDDEIAPEDSEENE